jgi:hypothetical protein
VLRASESAELTVVERGEPMEIRNERILKQKHSSTDIAFFWLSIRQE